MLDKVCLISVRATNSAPEQYKSRPYQSVFLRPKFIQEHAPPIA